MVGSPETSASVEEDRFEAWASHQVLAFLADALGTLAPELVFDEVVQVDLWEEAT